MTPIRTDYSNVTYTAEGCFDLPATIASWHDGSQEVETVWELTDEELEQINKDRRVYLYIMGRQMPPVFLSAKSELTLQN
jgi:hypothetical protein